MIFKINKTISWIFYILILLIIIEVFIIPCESTKDKIVKTPLGKIRGFQTSILDDKKRIYSFLGIPYAKPPIKKLRLQNPEPVKPWKGIYNAKKDSNSCVQIDGDKISGNEDCLYLNIFTPNANKNMKYPVMFFVHGGLFSLGSNEHSVLGPDFLLAKDIVLVVINYRLGPFGFASLEDDIIPGNFGLKDQSLALKWVHKYITYFGGDPLKVTIFGHSAGGASTHYHTLSPHNKGLFRRAIIMSGFVDCPWALDAPGAVKKDTIKLANILNCNQNKSSVNMLKCLQKIPAEKFFLALKQFQMWIGADPKPVFKPVLESNRIKSSFITKDSYFRNTNIPIMTGTASEEGTIATAGYFSAKIDKFNETLQELDDNFSNLAQYVMLYQNSANNTNEVTRKIREYFFKNKHISLKELRNLTDIITDTLFLEGSIGAIERNNGPTYVYKFEYYGQYTIPYLMTQNKFRYGICHSDDLIYLFPLLKLFGSNATFSSTDKKISNELVELYTNFAIHGNPTPNYSNDRNVSSSNTIWEPTDIKGDFQYLKINNEGSIMMNNYPAKRHAFWKDLPWRTKVNDWKLKNN